MKDHYQLSDESYRKLIESGVTVSDLVLSIQFFDPNKNGGEIGLLGLLYYVDSKGDFNEPPKFPHKRIASAIFGQLPIDQKIMVAEYIDDMENDGE